MVSTDRSIRHRIKKAIFDLQFPNESTAFSARKRLEEFFYQIVVPTLEEAFERYAPHGSIYRINHLEIDLGRINAEHLNPRLIRQIILTQLSSQLPELFATEVETTPDEVALEETLAGFLELGQWPWHMLFDQVEELEVALQALTPPRENVC